MADHVAVLREMRSLEVALDRPGNSYRSHASRRKEALDAAITALESSRVRGWWVLVPREPTDAMLDAWFNAPRRYDDCGEVEKWSGPYSAMLAAAPPHRRRLRVMTWLTRCSTTFPSRMIQISI